MAAIVYVKTGKLEFFATDGLMNDFIFDKGFAQKGNELFFETEDGKVELVGKIV